MRWPMKSTSMNLTLEMREGLSAVIGKIRQKAGKNKDLFWSFFKSSLFCFLFLWHHVPFSRFFIYLLTFGV